MEDGWLVSALPREVWVIHSSSAPPSFRYSCQEGDTKELWSSGHHLKSCRAVVFSEDGQSECRGRQPAVRWEGGHGQHGDLGVFLPELVTVSKDKAIHFLDVEQGRLERRISKAHG